jgi:outer membrane protein assembly factor BamB
VAGGRVFFGAGDDGLYCVEAATGKELWHYQNQLHIDANPVVVQGRLYCGGGVVGEAGFQSQALFCLDVATGRELWLRETDLPVMAAPAVADGHVFFGMGNGNFSFSGDHPKGAVVCVDAATGRHVWRYDVSDAVLTRPAVDGLSVFFGARDGNCYCVSRGDGRLRWRHDLVSPVLASPVWQGAGGVRSTRLYVASRDGVVVCLDPATGQPVWSLNLAYETQRRPQVLATPAVVSEGERPRVYLAAGLSNDATTSAALFCLEEN